MPTQDFDTIFRRAYDPDSNAFKVTSSGTASANRGEDREKGWEAIWADVFDEDNDAIRVVS